MCVVLLNVIVVVVNSLGGQTFSVICVVTVNVLMVVVFNFWMVKISMRYLLLLALFFGEQFACMQFECWLLLNWLDIFVVTFNVFGGYCSLLHDITISHSIQSS